jgi:hypothetical protein
MAMQPWRGELSLHPADAGELPVEVRAEAVPGRDGSAARLHLHDGRRPHARAKRAACARASTSRTRCAQAAPSLAAPPEGARDADEVISRDPDQRQPGGDGHRRRHRRRRRWRRCSKSSKRRPSVPTKLYGLHPRICPLTQRFNRAPVELLEQLAVAQERVGASATITSASWALTGMRIESARGRPAASRTHHLGGTEIVEARALPRAARPNRTLTSLAQRLTAR